MMGRKCLESKKVLKLFLKNFFYLNSTNKFHDRSEIDFSHDRQNLEWKHSQEQTRDENLRRDQIFSFLFDFFNILRILSKNKEGRDCL
jgi:hypothetical protein